MSYALMRCKSDVSVSTDIASDSRFVWFTFKIGKWLVLIGDLVNLD